MKLRVALPPKGTLFYRALRTTLSLLASYIGEELELWEQEALLEAASNNKLAAALESLVDDLERGIYGLEPSVMVDRARLNRLINYLGAQDARCRSIIRAYKEYVKKLATSGNLLDEMSKALSVFDLGYPNDSRICDVPMLNRLSPEYMESIRLFGGVGFGSVPKHLAFSRMRLGPHSTCLGLIGLWATLTYFNEALEYYVFPDLATGSYLAKTLKELPRSLQSVLSKIKRRPPTNAAPVALIVVLSTPRLPEEIRRYELAIVGKSGRRTDVLELGFPLSAAKLMYFADKLVGSKVGDDARERLLSLLALSLEEPIGVSKEEALWRALKEAGMRIAQAIFMALEGAIPPEEAAYTIARYTYAQDSPRLEDYLERKKVLLTPVHVRAIVEALREALMACA